MTRELAAWLYCKAANQLRELQQAGRATASDARYVLECRVRLDWWDKPAFPRYYLRGLGG
jgi:hypothetical protein